MEEKRCQTNCADCGFLDWMQSSLHPPKIEWCKRFQRTIAVPELGCGGWIEKEEQRIIERNW